MPRLRRNHARTFAVGLIATAILAGTGVVFALPVPESRSVVSEDGAVRIEGTWGSTASPPSIVRHEVDQASVAVRGASYTISAPPAPAGAPYHLTFEAAFDFSPEQTPVLYRFQDDLAAWAVYPSTYDRQTFALGADATRLPTARWGVGLFEDRGRPARGSDVLSGLLSAPPPGAVGYEAYDAFVGGNGDAVLLADPLDAGGCGGSFHVGRIQTKTSRDLVYRDGYYRVIVRWQTGNGCLPGEHISSAQSAP